ncbi:RNA polymerase sigma factor [Brevundimonas denitrificans]|uniref:RNA polymerase sigma factor n=1 Tax=Brevundimonas denitrificans TaxID=1443434 RepID=UPI00223B9999|nr:RNA polymerase sigma factor [Brevundimonas denitrificans]
MQFLQMTIAMSDHLHGLSRPDAAVQSLYDRYGAWLSARLIRLYGRQEAEDIAQETWVRLFRYKSVDIRHPPALLLRIASNLMWDRQRQVRRRQLEETASQRCHIVQAVQSEAVLIKELILSLPEPLRDVFLLSRVDGLTNAQIGEKLGLSPKTVEWRMTRALAHCAAQLRR